MKMTWRILCFNYSTCHCLSPFLLHRFPLRCLFILHSNWVIALHISCTPLVLSVKSLSLSHLKWNYFFLMLAMFFIESLALSLSVYHCVLLCIYFARCISLIASFHWTINHESCAHLYSCATLHFATLGCAFSSVARRSRYFKGRKVQVDYDIKIEQVCMPLTLVCQWFPLPLASRRLLLFRLKVDCPCFA